MIDIKKAVEIGQLIKQARKSKGMTQGELGKLLGVCNSAVQKYEKGIILNITLEQRFRIAVILNLPGYLLCSNDELNLIQKLFGNEQQYEI